MIRLPNFSKIFITNCLPKPFKTFVANLQPNIFKTIVMNRPLNTSRTYVQIDDQSSGNFRSKPATQHLRDYRQKSFTKHLPIFRHELTTKHFQYFRHELSTELFQNFGHKWTTKQFEISLQPVILDGPSLRDRSLSDLPCTSSEFRRSESTCGVLQATQCQPSVAPCSPRNLSLPNSPARHKKRYCAYLVSLLHHLLVPGKQMHNRCLT